MKNQRLTETIQGQDDLYEEKFKGFGLIQPLPAEEFTQNVNSKPTQQFVNIESRYESIQGLTNIDQLVVKHEESLKRDAFTRLKDQNMIEAKKISKELDIHKTDIEGSNSRIRYAQKCEDQISLESQFGLPESEFPKTSQIYEYIEMQDTKIRPCQQKVDKLIQIINKSILCSLKSIFFKLKKTEKIQSLVVCFIDSDQEIEQANSPLIAEISNDNIRYFPSVLPLKKTTSNSSKIICSQNMHFNYQNSQKNECLKYFSPTMRNQCQIQTNKSPCVPAHKINVPTCYTINPQFEYPLRVNNSKFVVGNGCDSNVCLGPRKIVRSSCDPKQMIRKPKYRSPVNIGISKLASRVFQMARFAPTHERQQKIKYGGIASKAHYY